MQPTPSATTALPLSRASRNSASRCAATRECGFAQAKTKDSRRSRIVDADAETSSANERVPIRTPSIRPGAECGGDGDLELHTLAIAFNPILPGAAISLR